jgi:hypothetical protein
MNPIAFCCATESHLNLAKMAAKRIHWATGLPVQVYTADETHPHWTRYEIFERTDSDALHQFDADFWAQGKIDWTDFAGRLLYVVQQEAKHAYLWDLSRNVTRGVLAATKNGRSGTGGRCPDGYMLNDGQVVLDPDRASIIRRIFEEYVKVPKMPNMDMALAGVIVNEIRRRSVDMVFVDVGFGHGTIDRLHEMGYRRIVQPVGFGERAFRHDVYMNKRSEMLIDAAEWINGKGVKIPDDDELHSDLAAVPIDETTSNGLKYIKPKKDIKKLLGGKSTDIFDAFALTFAYPVRKQTSGAVNGAVGADSGGWAKKDGGKSPLSSRNRR